MNKYIAEFFGTLTLTLVVILAISGTIPVIPALAAGVTLGLFVYNIGGISGAHINPAVTAGLWYLKKISNKHAAAYIIAQFLGAIVALMLARYFIGYASPLVAGNGFKVFFAELLGTFILTFGVVSTISKEHSTDYSGLVIGGSLFLGILIASAGSNGVLNPAVALGIGSFSWAYLFGPVIGSMLGAYSAKKLI